MAKDVPNNVLDVGFVRGTIAAGFALRERARRVKPELASELLAMAEVVENLTTEETPIELIDTRVLP